MAEPQEIRRTKAAQVREHLVAAIENGLQPHDKLPTERELAEELEVSRLTVRRALDQLERERIIYRVQGSGTFVSADNIAKSLELTSFTEDMRARGLEPGSRSIHVEIIPAGPQIGYELQLSPADEVVHINRVRTADDVPICLERSYLPRAFAGGLDTLEPGESLYNLLEARYGVRIDRAEQILRATVVEPDQAELLSVPPFSPALLVSRRTYDDRDNVVEYAETLYRGDRYSYSLTMFRGGG